MRIIILIISFYLVSCTPPQRDRQKLEIINQTLEQMVNIQETYSSNAFNALKMKIVKEGSSKDGLEAIHRANLMQEKTQSLVFKINTIIKQYQQQKKVEKKEINHLTTSLNNYVASIHQDYSDLLTEENVKALPYFTNTPGDRDFYHYRFARLTRPEICSYLNQLKFKINQYNHLILRKLGAGDISNTVSCFPFTGPIAISSSTTVMQDRPYQVDVLFTRSQPSFIYEVIFNGENIPLKRHNTKVSIPTTKSGVFSWKANIRAAINDQYKTFHLAGKYEVLDKLNTQE